MECQMVMVKKLNPCVRGERYYGGKDAASSKECMQGGKSGMECEALSLCVLAGGGGRRY